MNEKTKLQIAAPAAPPPPEAGISWNEIKQLTRRYASTVLIVFLTTGAGAYGVLSMLTELYETEATILVKLGRENLDPPAISRNVPLSVGLRHEDVVSEIAILQSPDLVVETVDQIGLEAFRRKDVVPEQLVARIKYELKKVARGAKEMYNDILISLDLRKRLDERQAVIAGISEALLVTQVKESDVISVKLRMPNPELARRVESKLIDLYLARRSGVRSTPGVSEFLNEAAQKRIEDLRSVEERRQEFRGRKGLIAGPEQKTLLLKEIRELSASLTRNSADLANVEGQLAASRKLLETTPAYSRTSEEVTPNPSVQLLKQRIISLEEDRSKALSKFTPGSQIVTSIDESLARLRNLLSQEEVRSTGTVLSQLNPNRQVLEQKIQRDITLAEGLRATVRTESAQLSRLESDLSSIDIADVKLSGLERDRTIAEQDYLSLVRRKLDTEISTRLDKDRISNVSILSAPASTLQPVYPKKLLVLGVALVGGLLLGFAVAGVMHYFEDTALDPRQVEALTGMTYLGAVETEEVAS